MTTSNILETGRLTLRNATRDDAPFVLRLLNEPSFIHFIGDRGVRTLSDAERYVDERFIASYERLGFGLWIVERKTDPRAIGISGLVKRDTLIDPDVGFAFLPEFWKQGFAFESAAGVVQYGFYTLQLAQLAAITKPDNVDSIRVVEKLGFSFDRMMPIAGNEEPARIYLLPRPGAQ